jgi:Putative Ig domain
MKRHPSTSPWIVCVVLLLSGCGGVNHDMTTPSLMITTKDAPAGATTVQYNGRNGFTLAATGGTPPYTWSWAPAPNSDLPPGLRLNGDSISGTPETSGEFAVVVTVTDSGHPAVQTSTAYTVSVDAPLKITSGQPPSGMPKVGYGPIGTIYLSCHTRGSLTSCVRCDPSIAGSCPVPHCTSDNLPSPCTKTVEGHTGFTFTATGGAAPYTWTGTGLPPGLGLYPKFGIMSGTPTTAGTYDITITVKDAEPTPRQVQAPYTVPISPGNCSIEDCTNLPGSACCRGYVCVAAMNRNVCVREPPNVSQSLSGQADKEVPFLQLDSLPGITGSSADSAKPQ